MQLANGIVTPVSSTEKLLGHTRELICELLEYVRSIADSFPKLPPLDQAVTLSNMPIQLRGNGYRYHLLFLSRSVTLTFTIPAIGQFPLTLEAGWNELGFPGTQLALTDGSSIWAIYRCTDTLEGE